MSVSVSRYMLLLIPALTGRARQETFHFYHLDCNNNASFKMESCDSLLTYTPHNIRAQIHELLKIIYIIYGNKGGGEIAQSVASLSATRSVQVRARYDLLVTER